MIFLDFLNSVLVGKTVPLKKIQQNCYVTLKKHAPSKKRYVSANQTLFNYKSITEEFMNQKQILKH